MAQNYSSGLDSFLAGIASDSGSATGLQVDAAWVFETSGECVFLRFVAPVSQSSGALSFYAYCTAVTGTPDFNIEIRNGPSSGDDDRPESGGSTIGTPASNVTPTANRWATFTVTGLSLTAGLEYYIILKNVSGTPASNHATWLYRGAIDSNLGTPSGAITSWRGGTSTDGFTGDPTLGAGTPACFVVKFNDGSIWGNPYVATSAHPSDANDRGNRVMFDQDVTVIAIGQGNIASISALASLEVTRVSNDSVLHGPQTLALGPKTNIEATGLSAPMTLLGGVEYNIVYLASGATTNGIRAYMGETDGNLPADVKACRPSWFKGWVGGATAPGSYSLTEGLAHPMTLAISAIQVPSGGTTIAGTPMLRGMI